MQVVDKFESSEWNEPRINIDRMECVSAPSCIIALWVNNWLDIATVVPKRNSGAK
jgi:hypothetical protein